MKSRKHDDAIAEIFADDPALAIHLLNDILRDGDQQDLLVAQRQLTKAFGGIARIAELANLNPTQLYRTLSAEGNPELRSMTVILKAMGMRLTVSLYEARKNRH